MNNHNINAGVITGGLTSSIITPSNLLAHIDWALAYASKGYYVFPIAQGRKDQPLTKNGYLDATRDPKLIKRWWTKWPNANIGVSCNRSFIVVGDLDRHPGKADGIENYKNLKGHEPITLTPTSLTANNGVHIIYSSASLSESERSRVKGKVAEGVDIKFNGYIIVPPSVILERNQQSKKYKWAENKSLLEIKPAPLPEWLKPHILRDITETNDTITHNTVCGAKSFDPNVIRELERLSSPPPANAEQIVNNCAFLRHFVDDADKLSEPDWYHGLGVLAFAENGTETIHRYSARYPNYSYEETQNKIDHWLSDGQGPTLCETIQKKCGDSHCKKCPFNGKIKSPIVLGYANRKLDEDTPEPWPKLAEAALHGLVGDIVKAVTADSEADPAAVLLTTLVRAGITFGAKCYVNVGETRHPPRLDAVLVGASSRARKGTSTNPVTRIFEKAEENLKLLTAATADIPQELTDSAKTNPILPTLKVSHGPLSSGEGLVYAVRDASDKVDKDGNLEDPGVTDKRLLVIEGELGAPLKAMQREGNTLSAIIRMAWDSGNIAPLTKSNRIKVAAAHIGILGHITRNELSELLKSVDLWNGCANRILWVCVRRQGSVPFPKPLPDETVNEIADRLAHSIRGAQNQERMKLHADAEALWTAKYDQLTRDETGIFGAVTARAEAQVIRIALVYALLDESEMILPVHLNAALSVWAYCRESARYIFGSSQTNPNVNKILFALKEGEKTQSQLNELFNGHMGSDQLKCILGDLQAVGRISQQKKGGGKGKGRAAIVWSICPGFNYSVAEMAEMEE